MAGGGSTQDSGNSGYGQQANSGLYGNALGGTLGSAMGMGGIGIPSQSNLGPNDQPYYQSAKQDYPQFNLMNNALRGNPQENQSNSTFADSYPIQMMHGNSQSNSTFTDAYPVQRPQTIPQSAPAQQPQMPPSAPVAQQAAYGAQPQMPYAQQPSNQNAFVARQQQPVFNIPTMTESGGAGSGGAYNLSYYRGGIASLPR